MLSSCSVWRLFKGGVYSGCGVYSRKYSTSAIYNSLFANLLLADITVIFYRLSITSQ